MAGIPKHRNTSDSQMSNYSNLKTNFYNINLKNDSSLVSFSIQTNNIISLFTILILLNKMQNQRLLYSQSKKPRTGPLNKQNNIKLFNQQFQQQSTTYSKKYSPQLRYDYQKNTRVSYKNQKTISQQPNIQNQTQKSPYKVRRQQRDKGLFNSSENLKDLFPSNIKPTLISSQQQIQTYTNKLLENNKNYQQQIFGLKQENALIKSQLQRNLAQNIRFRMSVQRHQEQTTQKFSHQIAQLVKQLKQILQAKEQMERQYNRYIEQITQQHSKQLQGREEGFVKTQHFFKEKLSNLSSHLSLNKEQRQKQYFEASQCKLKLMKEIDQLNFKVQKEKNEKRQFQKSSQEMIKIIKSLEKQLKQLKQKLQQTQIDVYKIEKQKNQVIIDLKNQNKSLCDGAKNLQTKILDLDSSLSKKQIQFQRLQRDLTQIRKQLEEKSKRLIENNLQLAEYKKSKRLLQQQVSRQSQSFLNQKSNLQNIKNQLQASQKSSSSEIYKIRSLLSSSQKQVSSLSDKLEIIQKQNTKINSEFVKLEQLNKKYKKDNVQFLEELQLATLQNKAMKQEKNLKENHIKTLQKICEQLQRSRQKSKQSQMEKEKCIIQKQLLQTSNYKQKVHIQAFQVEKLMNKKYETQLVSIRQQNLSLKEQIELIIEQYEQKLSQKQNKWRMRVEAIEKDLQSLMFVQKSNSGKNLIPIKQQDFQRGIDQRQQRNRRQFINMLQNRQLNQRKQRRSSCIIKNSPRDQEYQEFPLEKQEVHQSFNRRDSVKNGFADNSLARKKQLYFDRQIKNRDCVINSENSFKKSQNKYYDQIERKFNELSLNRNQYY